MRSLALILALVLVGCGDGAAGVVASDGGGSGGVAESDGGLAGIPGRGDPVDGGSGGSGGSVSKTNGQACGAAGECASGFCVDGMCCNSACGTACSSCILPGKFGTCSPVAVDTADARCVTTAATSCGTTGKCDAAGACAYWPAGTTCAPADCGVVGTERAVVFAKTCSATHACAAPNPAYQSCAYIVNGYCTTSHPLSPGVPVCTSS